jgi:hypothetical protein
VVVGSVETAAFWVVVVAAGAICWKEKQLMEVGVARKFAQELGFELGKGAARCHREVSVSEQFVR